MRLFSVLYDRALEWSRHRHAVRYLALLGFAEASFFPVPPDVMLAPMVLAERRRAWRLATITTLASAFGGIFGYLIGTYFFVFIDPWLHDLGYWPAYLQARDWFAVWGVWVVFIAGFTPIPYKVFTITAGAVAMPFLPFVVASIVGRGARFFVVAGLIHWGGERMQRGLRRHIDLIGWLTVILAVVAYLVLRRPG